MAYKLYKYSFEDTVSDHEGQDERQSFKWFEEGTQSDHWILCHDLMTIHLEGFDVGFDYKFVRDKIKEFYDGSNFYEISEGVPRPQNEILAFCEHKIGTHAERKSIVGQSNVVLQGIQYNENVRQCKSNRLAYAIGIIHNYLPDDAETIKNQAREVAISYLIFGDEGTLQGNEEDGLSDYLRGNGSFDGIGLIDQVMTPEDGLTMTDVVESAEQILFGGIY